MITVSEYKKGLTAYYVDKINPSIITSFTLDSETPSSSLLNDEYFFINEEDAIKFSKKKLKNSNTHIK